MTATIPKGFHPEPFSYHQELELDIDALSNAGDGIGRVDGWVVFVPFALPGDRVKARVWRNDKNYSSADLVEIINPSQDRVEPGCRLFGTCGGCQYQHLSYDRQLLWKTRQVADLLRLQAGWNCPSIRPLPPRQYHYRSKITPLTSPGKPAGRPSAS
ncbi:MAG: TRAM domain-containing protein [Akkermansia sp.]